jgi:hypothetical protein
MSERDDLNRALLARLLEGALEDFEEALGRETPGLSATEIARYMRAARKFSGHLLGTKPRTRGRQSRPGSLGRSGGASRGKERK